MLRNETKSLWERWTLSPSTINIALAGIFFGLWTSSITAGCFMIFALCIIDPKS